MKMFCGLLMGVGLVGIMNESDLFLINVFGLILFGLGAVLINHHHS